MCLDSASLYTSVGGRAVDFGRAWYVGLEIGAAAEAGALYGLGNVTDVPGMKAAALLDAPDLGSLQVSASYGSECSDGTAAVAFSTSVPVCAINVVSYVEVVTTGSYTPILRYPGFASVFNLSGKARMRTSN